MADPNHTSFLQSVARLLRRTCFGVVRATSAEFRAHTDLFYPAYAERVEWKSGLQDNHFVLYAIVRATRPRTIVEIGSARGKSTCTMALACRQNGRGKVYAIDPHLENPWTEVGVKGGSFEFLQQRLRTYHLEPCCEIIKATSQEVAPTWTKPIDILFIDGDHSYEGVRHDFEAFRPWLTPEALVAFHDTTWEYCRDNEYYREDMGVPRYMVELQEQGYHSVTFTLPPGLTILQATPGGFDFSPE